jgi:hypothetical protein
MQNIIRCHWKLSEAGGGRCFFRDMKQIREASRHSDVPLLSLIGNAAHECFAGMNSFFSY